MSKLIAVYGSLRKGCYNYDRFLAGYEPLGEMIKLEGYDMHDLGAYPAITRGSGTVMLEVYQVDDMIADGIAGMEIGAGYQLESVDTEWGKATFYSMPPSRMGKWYGESKRVAGGDWLTHITSKQGGIYA